MNAPSRWDTKTGSDSLSEGLRRVRAMGLVKRQILVLITAQLDREGLQFIRFRPHTCSLDPRIARKMDR